MSQVINTNLASLNAQRNLNKTQNAVSTSIQRLSSGLRVNSSKDDAAGLAIAERMSAQVRGMNVAIRNANDAISQAQVADGALGQISDMAQRMRELAVQSANATNSTGDRVNLDAEFQALKLEMERTINGTKFNGAAVLTNTASYVYQVGAGVESTDTIEVAAVDLTELTDPLEDITEAANATAALTALDSLIDEVNTQRAVFGAAQNRFEAVVSGLQVAVENQTAARSRIMDADFASETSKLTSSQVLQQAGQAMLSQANSTTSGVLTLLRNLG